jgi:Flp pilus assembly protein TadG
MIVLSHRRPGAAPASGAPGRRRARRRGAAAVELAVLVPLLGFVMMGMIEMSRAMMAKTILNDAARKACRAAVLPTGSNAGITADVTNILLTDNSISTANVRITVLVNDTAADANTAKQNDKISVKVALPYSAFSWTTPIFLSNLTVESETIVMMRQG